MFLGIWYAKKHDKQSRQIDNPEAILLLASLKLGISRQVTFDYRTVYGQRHRQKPFTQNQVVLLFSKLKYLLKLRPSSKCYPAVKIFRSQIA